jgi:glycosyltransferase involved in cell wall biosynthesis
MAEPAASHDRAARARPSAGKVTDQVPSSRSDEPSRSPELAELVELANAAGLRRVHMLAWRDLVDVEAGGSELHAAKIARIWAEAGLDVTMRTSYAQGHPPEGRRDGYRVIRRRGRYMVFPAAVIAELRGLYGPRDGLVEIWNGVPFLSPLWARGPKITLVHHVHRQMWRLVLEERLARMGEIFESKVAPPLYRHVPVLTLSESSRQELIEYMHLRPDRVEVVPPGVEPRFSPAGSKSSHPLIVSVGRLMPAKRFDDMIRIAATARARVPGLELVIIGDGYERENLEQLVRSLDADDWVRLPGKVTDDELLDLYRRAWAVTSASIAEGWGMTLTEAAACGTPSVATRIAGHQDSVIHGQTGLLADSVADFVEQLVALLTDRELRDGLSEGGQKHAASFTWDATALGVFSALARDALRRHRGRPSTQ